jgi:hypothetical protein
MLGPMTAAPAGSHARPTFESRDGPSADETPDAGDASDAQQSAIRVTQEGSTVVIVVEQTLDASEGDELVRAASAAVESGPDRLDIDLRALESYTDEGANALVACRTLGTQLAEGLHYRTGRGPGRDALLAAYQDVVDGNGDGG